MLVGSKYKLTFKCVTINFFLGPDPLLVGRYAHSFAIWPHRLYLASYGLVRYNLAISVFREFSFGFQTSPLNVRS